MTKHQVVLALAMSGHSQMAISNILNDRFPAITYPEDVAEMLKDLGIYGVHINENK